VVTTTYLLQHPEKAQDFVDWHSHRETETGEPPAARWRGSGKISRAQRAGGSRG
jgi:hypothetical protein